MVRSFRAVSTAVDQGVEMVYNIFWMRRGGGMADATDLKSVGLSAREGSSPSPGTMYIKTKHLLEVFFCPGG